MFVGHNSAQWQQKDIKQQINNVQRNPYHISVNNKVWYVNPDPLHDKF